MTERQERSSHGGVVRSAGIIGGFTAISRLLGFVRDMIIATAFGTGLGAEAFVVSFKIPNLLRDLVAEGATNAAFVPIFSECRHKKPEEFWGLVSTVVCVMGMVLAALSILGVVFAPVIVRALAPGFIASADPQKLPLTIFLTRMMFPYLFLIGLSALAMGVLNSLKEFTSSAVGPALLNISMIVTALFFEKTYGPVALVAGVLIGGALQLFFQIPPLLKSGFRFHKPDIRHPYVKKIATLLLPRAFGSALYQINILEDSILASFEKVVGPGGQSALYYANRLFQLPLAMLGLAMAQAVLPTFSSQLAAGDTEAFKKTISMAVRSLLFVMVPAATGLIVLSEPIVRIIFEHGQFGAYSTSITSSALFYYSFGLISCAMIKIFANAFYAMHDTRTPVKLMLYSVIVNFVLSIVFMFPMKIGGLTFASTISATLNMWLLYHFLIRKIGVLDERRIFETLLKVFLSAAVMAGFIFFFRERVLSAHTHAGRLAQGGLLAGGIIAAIAIYFVTALALKLDEAKKILRLR